MAELGPETIGESQLPAWPQETFEDVLPIPELEVPETLDPQQIVRQNILDATYTLDGDNGGILRDRFGMTGEDPKTIMELAEIYHRDPSRIPDIIRYNRAAINDLLGIRIRDWTF